MAAVPPIMAVAVVVCDCGHPATPDAFTPGYAVDQWGRSLCYPCAADRDRERARTMSPEDTPMLAYLRGDHPAPHSSAIMRITTWAGEMLGTATVSRGDRYNKQMHVTATIEGRRFHGRSPSENGTYVRLRPYRDQTRNH